MKHRPLDSIVVNGQELARNPCVILHLDGSDGTGIVCLIHGGYKKYATIIGHIVVQYFKIKTHAALIDRKGPLQSGQKKRKDRYDDSNNVQHYLSQQPIKA